MYRLTGSVWPKHPTLSSRQIIILQEIANMNNELVGPVCLVIGPRLPLVRKWQRTELENAILKSAMDAICRRVLLHNRDLKYNTNK